MNFRFYLHIYYQSVMWLLLACISHIPLRGLRQSLLRITGMRIGRSIVYSGFHIRAPARIRIGDGTVIGHGATLDGRRGIVIGNHVNLSSEVMIWTLQHDYTARDFAAVGAQVTIEDYAWLSVRCIVLPGVTIGRGAVVAAGAVVTRDVEPFTVVGGIPARKIAERPHDLDYSPAKPCGFPFI